MDSVNKGTSVEPAKQCLDQLSGKKDWFGAHDIQYQENAKGSGAPDFVLTKYGLLGRFVAWLVGKFSRSAERCDTFTKTVTQIKKLLCHRYAEFGAGVDKIVDKVFQHKWGNWIVVQAESEEMPNLTISCNDVAEVERAVGERLENEEQEMKGIREKAFQLIEQANKVKKMERFQEMIDQIGESNQPFSSELAQDLGLFYRELKTYFEEVSVEEKNRLKPYRDACLVSWAIIEQSLEGEPKLTIESAADITLTWENYMTFARRNSVTLFDNASLDKTFAEHLAAIKTVWKSTMQARLQSNLDESVIEKCTGRLAQKGWKNRLHDLEDPVTEVKQKEAVFPAEVFHKKSFENKEARFKDYKSADGNIAGFHGTTFEDASKEQPDQVLDATYFAVDKNGSMTFAGGDGYEHGTTLTRQADIRRTAYFGSKHLVRLARMFERPKMLLNNLSSLFSDAAQQVRLKRKNDEGSSATLIRVFPNQEKQMATIVTGSVGDDFAFAYTPEGEVIVLAPPHQIYREGSYKPVSFTEQTADILEKSINVSMVEVPLNSHVFYMTDGVWERLGSIKEKDGKIERTRTYDINADALAALLKTAEKSGSATTADYVEVLKNQCVKRKDPEPVVLSTGDNAETYVPPIGDDATAFGFKIV